MPSVTNPLARLGRLVREEKNEISSIYFFAILSGLIQLSLPLGIQSIIGFVLGGSMSTSLVILISFVVIGVACNGLLQMSQMKIIERIQQKLFVRYSFAFASHIPKLDLQKTDGYYLPELVNRFFDIPVLQKSISKILLDFPIAIIQILLGLLLLSFYHPAFIAFGILLLLVLAGIFFISGNKGFQTSLEKSTHKYAVAAWLEELARVIKQFKFAGHTNLHSRRTDEKVVSYLQARQSHFNILLLQYKVLIAFKVLITAAMLIVGCLLVLNQQINIGQFVASEIVIIIVITSVEKLIINLDSVYSALTSVEKISKLLDKPAEAEGSLSMQNTAMKVEFRNLSFGYTEGQTIVQNVSFRINAGEKVCLQGRNGSGKSTVLRLLTGAYNNFEGSVLLNDVPIGNYNLQSLRRRTGILLHHQDVFSGTLWENITMGENEVDKDYLLFLCKQTGLNSFIATQKEGFDTELHPTGRRLPRGVIQRILLVRSLLPKPKLLLIEEPLEAIEGENKKQIQELLLQLDNTTVIAISNDEAFSAVATKLFNYNKLYFMSAPLQAYQHIYLQGKKTKPHYWFYAFVGLLIVLLFLPWTQTVRGKGAVIALRQEQRPQQINTIIPGRIIKWFIKEGDFVKAGDTLAQLSEIKDSYLDPQLIGRTKEQIVAKQSSIDYYKNKVGTTQSQIGALAQALQLKISGLENKLRQTEIKLQSDSMEAAAAANDYRIATLQLNRQKSLFDSGLVSLTQLESRNQQYQNTMAKRLSAENKYVNTKQHMNLLLIEMNSARQEYAEKTAKAEGDRFQSLSEIATGEGEVSKLQNQYSSYSIRHGMYYIIAPQDGQIIQAKKAGIGEIVKEGEMLLNIVPDKIQYAVEMFVRPVDLPLVAKEQSVTFLFDGFPAIVFSGWPKASSGTFRGKIIAVEKAVSVNGKFRVLVAEDPQQKPWPPELKMGTGANGFALLKDVPVWYELWRNINSFPPDYYTPEGNAKTEEK